MFRCSSRASLTIIDREYGDRLSLFLHPGRDSGSAEVSLTLPDGSRFLNAGSLQALPAGESEAFTVLPKSIAAGKVRAIAAFLLDNAAMWEISAVLLSAPYRLATEGHRVYLEQCRHFVCASGGIPRTGRVARPPSA